MSSKNTSSLLVERLIEWGVDTIFALPGDGINGIYEALRVNQDKIKVIQVRHEEAAAFAACSYAKFSGRLGVCLATSGPGGIHLLNGLYDAKCDGQPVLAITGHTFHDMIGTHYQQDVDLDKLFMDVAAYNERVMGPAHVHNVLDEAIKVALSQRTVVHINIPKDIQQWTLDKIHGNGKSIGHPADIRYILQPPPASTDIEAAADVINRGKKVVILAGRGALLAREEILKLAEITKGVIVKPLLGKGVVPDDSPYTTGGIGLLGTAPSQDAMQNCDTLVMVGTSFPYMEFYPRNKVASIQIDIDPSHIGLRYHVDVGIVGDCKNTLQAILPYVLDKTDQSFLLKAQQKMKQWNDMQNKQATRQDRPLKPQMVIHQMNPYIEDDAIVCTDTGTVTVWAARFIHMKGTMKFSASGSLASMGNGLPYAVGAAMAQPGKQIICLCGDGGFTMLMGELATIAKYNLPVKIVILKNNSFGHIKVEQMVLEGNPEYGVDIYPIHFALYAEACGIKSYVVEEANETPALMERAFEDRGPALIEARIDPYEMPMPGHITSEQAIHFTQAMVRGEKDRWSIIKTLMEDKIREVV